MAVRDWEPPRAWVEQVLSDMLPKLEDSSVALSLIPDAEGDVKFWVELGASIMLEKPIIVLAMPGRKVPPKLREIADEIVYLPDGLTPDSGLAVQRAVERTIRRNRRRLR